MFLWTCKVDNIFLSGPFPISSIHWSSNLCHNSFCIIIISCSTSIYLLQSLWSFRDIKFFAFMLAKYLTSIFDQGRISDQKIPVQGVPQKRKPGFPVIFLFSIRWTNAAARNCIVVCTSASDGCYTQYSLWMLQRCSKWKACFQWHYG